MEFWSVTYLPLWMITITKFDIKLLENLHATLNYVIRMQDCKIKNIIKCFSCQDKGFFDEENNLVFSFLKFHN